MKSARAIILTMLLLATVGCSANTAPGTAAVVLLVSAEPKIGAKDMTDPGLVMDYAPLQVGPTSPVDYTILGDIIVWLEPVNAAAALPAMKPILIDSTAPSQVIRPAAVGQAIRFHNSSGKAWSVYSVCDGNEFDLPSITPGGDASITIRGKGQVEILADPTKPPVAVIFAVPSPWSARATAGDQVTFNNLPPGQYRAMTWHPRLPGSCKTITLTADQSTTVKVDVSVNNLGQTH